jgi:ankyrin repeat protein
MNRNWSNGIQNGDIDALRSLLHHGADINSRDKYGQTGLMIAARDGKVEVVRFLIQSGAQLNHHAKFGLTALMLAVINQHTGIVRLLVDAGADLDIQGSGAPGFAGKTALDIATAQGSMDMVEVLDGNLGGGPHRK